MVFSIGLRLGQLGSCSVPVYSLKGLVTLVTIPGDNVTSTNCRHDLNKYSGNDVWYRL